MVILQPVIYKRFCKFSLAAVVVLLLKFSRPFTNGIGCFMAFSLESSISFLMSYQAKSHFAIFQVLLFLRTTCCFLFLCRLNMEQFKE